MTTTFNAATAAATRASAAAVRARLSAHRARTPNRVQAFDAADHAILAENAARRAAQVATYTIHEWEAVSASATAEEEALVAEAAAALADFLGEM